MNALLKECIANIPADLERQLEMSFAIADRLDVCLKEKGMSQSDLARLMGKRRSEVSKWLTGRHNFTLETIAKIETAIGSNLISI